MYLSDSYPLLRFVAADSEELVSLGKKTLELKSEFLNFQIVRNVKDRLLKHRLSIDGFNHSLKGD